MAEPVNPREELSPGQKKYVVRCFMYMAAQKKAEHFRGQRTRDLVAACLGIGHGTVTTVLEEFNNDNETEFEPTPTTGGKPRAYGPAVLEPVIRSYITTQNKLAHPVTAQKIILEVTGKTGVTLQLRIMQRLINGLGFHFIVGKKRHISTDSPDNAAYRRSWLIAAQQTTMTSTRYRLRCFWTNHTAMGIMCQIRRGSEDKELPL